MKKVDILNKLLFSLVMFLLFGCYEEHDKYTPAYEVAGMPVVVKVDGYYNLLDIENAKVSIKLDKNGENVESVDVYAMYNQGSKAKVTTISEFPKDFDLHIDQVTSALSLNKNDLVSGDAFDITFLTKLSNGKVYSSGVTINATVACESSLAGTYTARTSGQSTDDGPTPDENPITDYPYQITLTATSTNGVYTISDFSGGLYDLWYDIYGASGNWPGTIKDVCNELSYINTKEPFGTAVTGTGSVDGETGVITLSGKNGYDDTWTMVLTPNP